ncbi:MAG TPA: hypothetical protein VMZ25_06065 [Terriglobales bacterium]|nr:hypothetical protein [Terriglobales bacterium]
MAIYSSAQQARQIFTFRHHTPMGGDAVILMPAKERIQLMATLESKELEGVRQIRDGKDEYLRAADGGPFRFYPSELKFRFSIGKKILLTEKNPNPIETTDSPDEFQSNLRFQLKIFQGLNVEVIEPEETRIIGVPKNIPYDERIYTIRFKLPRQVPAHERMKFEVFDRNGNQIAKFQLQLMSG